MVVVIGRGALLKSFLGLVVLVLICISVNQAFYLRDNESALTKQPRKPNPVTLVGHRTMHENYTPIPHPKVFIVSMPRSGSTFMLEIFKNHPDFLPLFETTKWMRRHPRICDISTFASKPMESAEAQWFRDIYSCDFSDYTSRLGQWGATKSGDKSKCTKGDPPSKIVVAKEIWPWGIRLDWLDRVVGDDLRVIYLTRDVRGFVSSYTYIPVFNITIYPTADTLNSVDRPYNVTKRKSPLYQTWRMDRVDLWVHFCLEGIEVPDFLRPRMKFIKRVMQDKYAAPHLRMASVWTIMTAATQFKLERHIKGRYMSVSHTELSLNPHQTVDEMFAFLGQGKATPPVHAFLESHTRAGNYTVRHSTTRNSTEAAIIYLSRLTSSQIADIEAIAQGVMEPLGFTPIFKDKAKLDADFYERTSKGKVEPRPPMPHFAWEEEEERKAKEKEKEQGRVTEEKGQEEEEEESEEEEVTEEEAKQAEMATNEELWKEVEKEVKTQVKEEVRKELMEGITVKMPEEMKTNFKNEMTSEMDAKIAEMKADITKELKEEIKKQIVVEYEARQQDKS